MIDSVSEKPSVIIITEVKPKTRKSIDVAKFAINGYDFFANDFENLNARGIIIYVNKNFNVNPVDLNFDYNESLVVKINKFDQKEDLTIIGVYRSPNSINENNPKIIEIIKHTVKVTQGKIMYIEDFNLGDVNWDDCVSPKAFD